MDWKSLGYELGLGRPLLNKIQADEATEERRRREVLHSWWDQRNYDHEHCWETIIEALHSPTLGKTLLGNQIAEKYGASNRKLAG